MDSSMALRSLLLLIFVFASRVESMFPLQLSRAEYVHMAGYGEERLSSVLVAGTIQCDACLAHGSQLHTSDVPGARVAVACKTNGKRWINRVNGTTDEYGEFIIDIPSQLHAMPKLENACIVRVLDVPNNSKDFCRHSSGIKPTKRIKLSSVGNSIRVYTAGTIRLRHKTKPSYQCSRKSKNIVNSW